MLQAKFLFFIFFISVQDHVVTSDIFHNRDQHEDSIAVATAVSMLPPSFDQITAFVINLDRRPDRWDTFREDTTPKLGLLVNRCSAVDGADLLAGTHPMSSTYRQEQCSDMIQIMENNPQKHAAVIGRAASHRHIWSTIAHGKEGAFVVLEDDMVAAAVSWQATFQKKKRLQS